MQYTIYKTLEKHEARILDKETGEILYEGETLYDVKNGRKVDWRKYKKLSQVLAEVYLRLGKKYQDVKLQEKSYRVGGCAEILEFVFLSDGSMKLDRTYFCKNRLCPMCSWRRSLKVFGQVSKVMDYITERNEFDYIFLTLTARNVKGEELSSEFDRFFKAFNALFKRKEVQKMTKGWFRALEVTRNWERDDYHPHFHVIVAVNKSYFKESSVYLTQSRWTELWRDCLGIDYTPIVDVRRIKPVDDVGANEPFSVRYRKAVSEVAKYTLKFSDVMMSEEQVRFSKEEAERLTDETVYTLDKTLAHRRLIAFGGKLREAHKALNLDDVMKGDLVKTDNEEEIRDDLKRAMISFRWVVGVKDYLVCENSD